MFVIPIRKPSLNWLHPRIQNTSSIICHIVNEGNKQITMLEIHLDHFETALGTSNLAPKFLFSLTERNYESG